MADVEVSYKGSTIGSLSASGSLTLETEGKYCEADIGISYTSPGGGTLYYTSNGVAYMPYMDMPKLWLGKTEMYRDAVELVSVTCGDTRLLGGSAGNGANSMFKGCTKLETVTMPYIQGAASSWVDNIFMDCTSLKTASFGSVGYPISQFNNTSNSTLKVFRNDTQNDLTITLFVDASVLADIPSAVTQYAPWGATNATVVYRNSTTGEVITA